MLGDALDDALGGALGTAELVAAGVGMTGVMLVGAAVAVAALGSVVWVATVGV